MFQRIARRHADRSDEPVTSEHAGAPPADPPTEPIEAVAPAPSADQPTGLQPAVAPATEPTLSEPAPARRAGFRARGRMRRRLRYLRKLRELQVRDLGGLVFDLRRFERQRDDLVAQKLDQLRVCDDELRSLELALDERRDLRDVREAGIGGTCPRCFAIFGSADRFCASCGAALGGAVQGPAQVGLAPPPVAVTPPPAAAPPPVPPPSVAPPQPQPPAAAPAAPPSAPPEAGDAGSEP